MGGFKNMKGRRGEEVKGDCRPKRKRRGGGKDVIKRLRVKKEKEGVKTFNVQIVF